MPKKSGSASGRNVRIADQIQRDLAELIQREIKNPAMGLVTLQSVTLTPDYAHAKVYFTVLGAEPRSCGGHPEREGGLPAFVAVQAPAHPHGADTAFPL